MHGRRNWCAPTMLTDPVAQGAPGNGSVPLDPDSRRFAAVIGHRVVITQPMAQARSAGVADHE